MHSKLRVHSSVLWNSSTLCNEDGTHRDASHKNKTSHATYEHDSLAITFLEAISYGKCFAILMHGHRETPYTGFALENNETVCVIYVALVIHDRIKKFLEKHTAVTLMVVIYENILSDLGQIQI